MSSLFAQTLEEKRETDPKESSFFCGSSSYESLLLEKDETLKKRNGSIKNYQNKTHAPITIPVVVHILHKASDNIQGVGTNLSDARVLRAIQWLNDGFSNQGKYADAQYTFNSNVGVDTEIKFCLAKIDPSGNPTNGVTRTIDEPSNSLLKIELTSNPNNDDYNLKHSVPSGNGSAPSGWDNTRYLNIWIVDEICDANLAAQGVPNNGCVIKGYSSTLSSQGNWSDGIVMDANDFGNKLENSFTLVHEAGHFCGLAHTFGGAFLGGSWLIPCNDNDGLLDTPIDNSTRYHNCAATVHNCLGIAELTDNFMDYGNPTCINNFTNDQASLMSSVFAPGGIRSSFVNSTSPIACATGTYCEVDANFTSLVSNASQLTIDFSVTSTFPGATYTWDFGDGGLGTTAGNGTTAPTHTYTANGTYPVCLTITLPCGQDLHCSNVTAIITDNCVCDSPVNLIVNPGFDNALTPPQFNAANLDFFTDFGACPLCSNGPTCGAYKHFIGSSLAGACTFFASIQLPPHSPPNMAIFDGIGESTTINEAIVLSQDNISVVAGTNYLTSFFFNHWQPNGAQGDRPTFRVSVIENNGVGTIHNIGNYGQNDLSTGIWQELCNEWLATTTGQVEFRITQDNRTQNQASTHMDHYAIDDLFFGTCSCSTDALFTAPSPVCKGENVTFTNTSTNGANYEWYVDGAFVGTTTDLIFSFPSAGNYTIELIASNGACSDQISQTVTILPSTGANFSISTTTPCIGEAVQLTYSGSGNVFSVNNQNLSPNGSSTSWTPNSPGVYWIKNTVVNKGCSEETVIEVIVTNCCTTTTPTGLDCKQSKAVMDLFWLPVSDAIFYEISVTYNDPECCEPNDCLPTTAIHQTTSPSFQFFSPFPCFSWKVRSVCANGEKSKWSKSRCSCGTVKKCIIDPPVKFKCKRDPSVNKTILQWSNVYNAASYEVTITYNDKKCCKVNSPLLSYSKLISTIDTKLVLPSTTGCFSWKVRAICKDGTVSKWSIRQCSCPPLEACIIKAPIKLSCEIDPKSNTTYLLWSSISNAVSYEVSVTYNDKECCKVDASVLAYSKLITTIDPKLVLPTSKECFSWKVRAICKDGTASQWSSSLCSCGSIEGCIIKTPTKLFCERDKVSNTTNLQWSPISNATSYEVSISYNDPKCCKFDPAISGYSKPTTTIDPKLVLPTTKACFSWKVRAICKDGTASKWSDSICNCN
jgi:PKD repeat protein